MHMLYSNSGTATKLMMTRIISLSTKTAYNVYGHTMTLMMGQSIHLADGEFFCNTVHEYLPVLVHHQEFPA